MFKKYKKLISLFVAILMLSASFVTAKSVKAYAASTDIVYVALGDSVAYGMSASTGNGYTELLKTYLDGNPLGGSTVYQNLSSPGFTAEDLYRQVKDKNYAQTVATADIITINIGGNNILGAVIGLVKSLYPDAPDTLDGLNQAVNTDPSRIAAIMEKLKDPASPESKALNLALIAGVSSFSLYYPLLIKEIRTLAPKAEIYVNTLYSPVQKEQDLIMLLNPFIHSININIRSYQFRYMYKVVDVYSAFRLTRKNVVDFNITSYPFNVDIHPNNEGHRLIFNTLKLRLRTAGSKYFNR